MDAARHATVIDAFESLVKGDPTRPLCTFYDDAVGERTELSGHTLANWVNKTANLLLDGCGLGEGDVAAVRLPAHWQTAAVLLGCWSAGLPVDLGSVPVGSTEARAPVGVAFVADPFLSDERLAEIPAADVFALALAPLAAPFRPGPPPGTLDYVVEVRAHGDHFRPISPVLPRTVALAGGATHADLVSAASAGTGRPRIAAGSRVLIDGDAHPDPIAWLVTPLLAGASVVLCRNLDPARLPARLETERAVDPFAPR
jgi:uncharacterized protein (TIGR03089 family)